NLKKRINKQDCFSALGFSKSKFNNLKTNCGTINHVGSDNMEKPEGQVFRLSDVVGYQDGTIVSRALIDERSGVVMLFAFDEAQELSEHTVPYSARVIILKGQAETKIDCKPLKLKEGEAVITSHMRQG
ncbi:MAG: hypothetical protein QXJ82_03125, partial [Nitrososphaerota archaeon]